MISGIGCLRLVKEQATNMEKVTEKHPAILLQEQGPKPSSIRDESTTNHRSLRLYCLSMKDSIMAGDEVTKGDLEKLTDMINKVEMLYHDVHKPRQQVADAEALLNITQTLFLYLKSSEKPKDVSNFVSCVVQQYEESTASEGCKSISWKRLGFNTSSIFRGAAGVRTMLGSTDTKLSEERSITRRKRARPVKTLNPLEVEEDAPSANKIETDRNIVAMFEILKKWKLIQLEKLVLNRLSFAQTVENIFALSFLVKEGRAEIKVNESGIHLVAPRNAPMIKEIASGEHSYHHFVLRFDYKDWQLMLDTVEKGEEVMPHRIRTDSGSSSVEKL